MESHLQLTQAGTVFHSVMDMTPFMQGANSRGFVALQSSGSLMQIQELCWRE